MTVITVSGLEARVINRTASGMIVEDIAAYADEYKVTFSPTTLEVVCSMMFPEKARVQTP